MLSGGLKRVSFPVSLVGLNSKFNRVADGEDLSQADAVELVPKGESVKEYDVFYVSQRKIHDGVIESSWAEFRGMIP